MNNYTHNVFNSWSSTNKLIYKKNNLVCVLVYKNASMYYEHLFSLNQWLCVDFSEIDWERHHVFGFIQDPVVRFKKGLTEDIFNYENKKNYIDFLQKNITDTIIISEHTTSIFLECGLHSLDIDWIPLDDSLHSNLLLQKLLDQYQEKIDFDLVNDIHSSSNEKLELYKKINNILGNANQYLYKYLAFDIDLYNNVKAKFNSNKNNWNEISWIPHQLL